LQQGHMAATGLNPKDKGAYKFTRNGVNGPTPHGIKHNTTRRLTHHTAPNTTLHGDKHTTRRQTQKTVSSTVSSHPVVTFLISRIHFSLSAPFPLIPVSSHNLHSFSTQHCASWSGPGLIAFTTIFAASEFEDCAFLLPRSSGHPNVIAYNTLTFRRTARRADVVTRTLAS
jgi:hypothetical protein